MSDIGLDPHMQLTIKEKQFNATDATVVFIDGNVLNDSNEWHSTTINNLVKLNFYGSQIISEKNFTHYIAKPYLIYDFPGEYATNLSVYG